MAKRWAAGAATVALLAAVSLTSGPACTLQSVCDLGEPGTLRGSYCAHDRGDPLPERCNPRIVFTGSQSPGSKSYLVRWESSPIEGPWISYPGNTGIDFYAYAGGAFPVKVDTVSVYLAEDAYPQNPASSNFDNTQVGGDLAIVDIFRDGQGNHNLVHVFNHTCTQHFIRVVIDGSFAL